MLALFASLLAAAQFGQPPAVFGRDATALLFSTVGQSEWCPAGHVRLDLRTGRYAHTPTASRLICNNPQLQRPVRTGRLSGDSLAAVRSAFRRVQAEGLKNDACRDGRRPEAIIISNGGPRIMVLTHGTRSEAAPDDLSCWTQAAHSLHQLLERQFPAPPRG